MDPLTLTYLALMAASTGASAMAQHKTNKARSKVFAEERKRRSERDRNADALAQNTLNETTRTTDKETQRAAELTDLYRRPNAGQTSNAAGTRFLDTAAGTGDAETIKNVNDAHARSDAKSNQRTAAFAKVGAFGDVNAANALLAARNQQDIGLQNSMLEGWQGNVLPAILNKANMAGRDWATSADIMKLAATMMSLPALAKTGATTAGSGTTAADIGAARYGDFASKGFGGVSGSVPFGSSFGVADAAQGAAMADMPAWMQRYMPPTGLDAQRFGSMYDPFDFVPPGSRPLPARF